jgi:hypothetical protein
MQADICRGLKDLGFDRALLNKVWVWGSCVTCVVQAGSVGCAE